MAKRIVIRLGDIFGLECDDCYRYFQYVADDMTMLNSRVIRVFKEKYPQDEVPELAKVAQGEIDFYAHTSINVRNKNELVEKGWQCSCCWRN